MLQSPCSTTREATTMRSRSTATKSSPHSSQLEQASVHQRRPSATENKIDKLFLKSLIGYLKKEECSHTLFSPPTHSDSLQPSFYPHLPTKISLTLVTNNLHIGKPFGHFPVSILLALSGIYDSVGHPFPLEILSLVFCGTTLSWLISHHCPCSSFSIASSFYLTWTINIFLSLPFSFNFLSLHNFIHTHIFNN